MEKRIGKKGVDDVVRRWSQGLYCECVERFLAWVCSILFIVPVLNFRSLEADFSSPILRLLYDIFANATRHISSPRTSVPILNMAGAASNNQQNPESGAVVIVPERKVRQNFSSTQETPSKGVNTRKSRKTSSQVVEIEDTDSGPNDGDDRLSDGDYGSEKKKSSREKEEEKIKKQMTWVTDWKWKVTPSKKRELQLNEYWNMILTRDREIRLLKETIKKKDERIKGLRDEKVKELNERLRGKNTKIGDIQRGKDSLKEHLKEVRSELEKLKRDVDEKDIAISGMTAERLKLLDKSDMPFLPDDTVTAIFNKLFRETREWVKKWGIADWSTVPAEHTLEVCERILQMKPANFASQGAAQAILMGKIPLKVVLLAIINGTLCLRTFMRPFDSIKTHADQDPATRGMDRLQVVFNYLRKRRLPSCCTLNPGLTGDRHRFRCSPISSSRPARLFSARRRWTSTYWGRSSVSAQ